MKGFLTTEERSTLLKGLRSERKRRHADRIRVILLLDEGKSYESIASYLFIDIGTVNNWRIRYEEGGIKKLINDDYIGRITFLDKKQLKLLEKELDSKIYPNTKAVITFIKNNFGIKYSHSGAIRLLHDLKYSFIKATPVPGKADREEQEDFIELYERLKDKYSSLFFMDATHPHYAPVISYGWVKTGKRFEVKTNSGTRQRVNICGALEINSLKTISGIFKKINKETIQQMLINIRKNISLKTEIGLILDGASYNRALEVEALAKELNIQLIPLPRYSPNLNLIERVWKFLKSKVLANEYYEKFEDFRNIIAKFLKSINSKKFEPKLRSLLTEDFHLFNTA